MFKQRQLVFLVLVLCLGAASLGARAQERRKWAVIYDDTSQGAIVYQTEAGEQRLAVLSGFSPSYTGSLSNDNRMVGPSRFYIVKVSPRGRHIAFVLFSGDKVELKVYERKSERLVVDSAVKLRSLAFNTDETRLAISTSADDSSQGQEPLPMAQGRLLIYDLTAPQTIREPLLTLTSAEAAELAAADASCAPFVHFFIGDLVIWNWQMIASEGTLCSETVYAWDTAKGMVSPETLPLPAVRPEVISAEYATEENLRAIKLDILEDTLLLTAISPSRPELIYGGLELALRTSTGSTPIAQTPNFAFAWFVQNGDRIVSLESAEPLDEVFFLSQIFAERYQDVIVEKRYILRLLERDGAVLFTQTLRRGEPMAVPYGLPSRDGVYFVEYSAEGINILHVTTQSGVPSAPELVTTIKAPSSMPLWIGDSE